MSASASNGDLPTSATEFVAEVFPRYAKSTGNDRYSRFIAEVLQLQRTHVQDQILQSLHEHKQTVVVAANGVGKSYIAAAGGLAALYCNPDTIVNVTAGNQSTLKTNIWKPARSLFRDSPLHTILPGRTLDGTREIQTGLDDEWFFECVSPRYPDDLEGPHNDHVIYIVEEADKPGVTAEHIESVRSTATDDNDRALVIANPPRDGSNVVAQLMESEEWHTLQFPSWESHNVRVDRGLEDGPKIPGLADTSKLEDDWREYHTDPWPGLDQAIAWTDPASEEFRDDLDSRWYRRRGGVMPPADAETWRPFSVADVRAAWSRSVDLERETPRAVGIDVARSGDQTVAYGLHNDTLRNYYAEQGTNHVDQRYAISDLLNQWPEPDVAIDAIGEGSSLADELDARHPNITRFANDSVAAEETTYRNKWTEGLHLIGQWLRDGGVIEDRTLREELLAAARTIEFSERHLASRGRDGANVIEATSKSDIKDRLGRSPDHLDAALMAVWIATSETGNRRLPLSF